TLLSRRVERLERLAAHRLHPGAVDQQTAGLDEALGLLGQALGKVGKRERRSRPIGRAVRCGDGNDRLLTIALGAARWCDRYAVPAESGSRMRMPRWECTS